MPGPGPGRQFCLPERLPYVADGRTRSGHPRLYGAGGMTVDAVLLQQVINGLSLGAMYALLALGFTLVYGILELINFAHFNVFMVGSFVAMWTLQLFGLSGQSHILPGFALSAVMLFHIVVTTVSGV